MVKAPDKKETLLSCGSYTKSHFKSITHYLSFSLLELRGYVSVHRQLVRVTHLESNQCCYPCILLFCLCILYTLQANYYHIFIQGIKK